MKYLLLSLLFYSCIGLANDEKKFGLHCALGTSVRSFEHIVKYEVTQFGIIKFIDEDGRVHIVVNAPCGLFEEKVR
jgi:hypothetical protein